MGKKNISMIDFMQSLAHNISFDSNTFVIDIKD